MVEKITGITVRFNRVLNCEYRISNKEFRMTKGCSENHGEQLMNANKGEPRAGSGLQT